MVSKIEFLPEAAEDFARLDGSLKEEAAKKLEALSKNPTPGFPLGNKAGIDLSGFYKLYFAGKKYRIVYRFTETCFEIIEIVSIGKRDKSEIYKLVSKRFGKMPEGR